MRQSRDVLAGHLHDRQREDGPGRCSDRVRVPRVALRVPDEQRIGAGRVGCTGHRAEVAGLLDPDRDEQERAVLGDAAVRDLDDGDHALRLVAVGSSCAARARSTSSPSSQAISSGAKYVAHDGEPGRARASHLARPFGDEEPSRPPRASLPQPDHLFDARIVDGGDHGQAESSHGWWQPPSPNCAQECAKTAETGLSADLRR